MASFGLKLGLDLEMRAAHPHQKFQGVPPGDLSLLHARLNFCNLTAHATHVHSCGLTFHDV